MATDPVSLRHTATSPEGKRYSSQSGSRRERHTQAWGHPGGP